MGVEEVAILSSAYSCQNVTDPVSDWLRSGNDEYHTPYLLQQHPWILPQYKFRKDADQASIASVDDTASVTDSSHGSYSSESSTRTSWTAATDPVDVLSDEEEKEQCRAVDGQPPSDDLHEHQGVGADHQALGGGRSVTRAPLPKPNVVAPSQPHSQPCAPAPEWPGRRCQSRRLSLSHKGASFPPKLKRDTDVSEQFVSLLVAFATRLITAIWPLSANPPMMSTCFNGAGVLPLRVFIQETLRRSKTSYSTLQIALYYLILLKAKLPPADLELTRDPHCEKSQCRAMQCGRRMFLSALMLASKYLQDRNYSARAWSKISGLRSTEINDNEREFLYRINYDLHVPKESFDNWSKLVLTLSKLSKESSAGRAQHAVLSLGHPGRDRHHASLVTMVSECGIDEPERQRVFSDHWWINLVQTLDPSLVKSSHSIDDFLRDQLPEDRLECLLSSSSINHSSRPWDSPLASTIQDHPVCDLNLCDVLKNRCADSVAPATPRTPPSQTPPPMSPANSTVVPMRPQLRNLPTPQSTPRMTERCRSPTRKHPLRCSASLDALGSLRRQCFNNANLERCPPPRPQVCGFPEKTLLRPAETIQVTSGRATSLAGADDGASALPGSTPLAYRSRSSSLSSSASWFGSPSIMRFEGSGCQAERQYGLALPQLSRGFDAPRELVARESNDLAPSVSTKFQDEGYGSGEEHRGGSSAMIRPTSTEEFDAVHVLMAMSTSSESLHHPGVAPQSTSISGYGSSHRDLSQTQRRYKRPVLKMDRTVQLQAKRPLSVEEQFHNDNPKQWQLPTKDWAAPKRALPSSKDHKRIASYCSVQQFSSVPDLSAQYLHDSMVTAS